MNGRATTPLSGGGLILAIAVLLGLTRWFPGPGLFWSALLFAGGIALWTRRLVPPLATILVPAVVAVAVGATAYMAYFGIGMLPWMLASLLLLQGLGARIEWRRARSGYPLIMVGALAVCLVAIRQTWFEQPPIHTSMATGSLDYTFGWAPGTPAVPGAGMSWYLQYNPRFLPWTISGYELSGLNMSGALPIVIVLTALAVWSLWRDEASRRRLAPLATAGAVAAAAWVAPRASATHLASVVFLAAVVAMAGCAWKIGRGHDSGEFDLDDLSNRFLKARRGS